VLPKLFRFGIRVTDLELVVYVGHISQPVSFFLSDRDYAQPVLAIAGQHKKYVCRDLVDALSSGFIAFMLNVIHRLHFQWVSIHTVLPRDSTLGPQALPSTVWEQDGLVTKLAHGRQGM